MTSTVSASSSDWKILGLDWRRRWLDEPTGSTNRALLAWDGDTLKRVRGPEAHALRDGWVAARRGGLNPGTRFCKQQCLFPGSGMKIERDPVAGTLFDSRRNNKFRHSPAFCLSPLRRMEATHFPIGHGSSRSIERSRAMAWVWIWHTRDSLTPMTSPISRRFRSCS